MDSIPGNGAKNLVFSNDHFITLISMVKNPRLLPEMVHFLPSEDLSNRLLVHCVKSAEKKTFACSSEILKELK